MVNMMARAPRRSKASPKKKDRIKQPRQRFKELRLSKDISQSKMASDLEISDVTLRMIENGQNDPSFMMSYVYALYLGTTVEEVFPDVVEEAKKYFKTLEMNFKFS
ncbi:helix-turn-helix transcriptional regulator [Paenibacillus sedimenti]|uniref:Helix-turn-helix domain-containing protein n=1 Tax=Paenibacillus sedimenti TaxID=2770274 RepID=A0A926QK95_9BACL|nr:helix-turn-helix domain-containing protein [Paenibacillus sedimenti]MBD0381249.1 helix-turn-helix domain-containing protein [Paenibacillus sedimenti]